MKKYDCNKFLDLKHEHRRLCDSHITCSEGCPLKDHACLFEAMEQEEIDILQKWSDEHPEPPKLRRRELDFMTMFRWPLSKRIERAWDGCLSVTFEDAFEGGRKYSLCDSWFGFIKEGESMTFEELLKLEVEN